MFDTIPPLDPSSETPFWLFGTVTERLETVLCMPPSSQTWQALEMIGRCTLDPIERILFMVGWDQQVNAANALMHAAVADATTATPDLPPTDLDTEAALALRRSPEGMQSAKVFAHRLVATMPVMHQLMLDGKAGISYARVLEDQTLLLTDAQIAHVDENVSPRAATTTLAAFRRLVKRAVAAIDPDNARKRHERARKETSGARVHRREDGMSTVGVTMPTPQAVEVVNALNARADRLRVPDDPRTHGERQVEALRDALADAPVTGSGKVRSRRSAVVHAFIDLPALLGLRERPGEIAGHGPVPAQTIRDMLADDATVLHRLVHDPLTGNLRDYGVDTYEPDEQLRGIIETRDVTCRFPGCTRNAAWCDSEHCDPYDDGGPTSCANCGLMCRRHHNLKTHEGFRYRRTHPETGVTEWTTPLGFVYRQDAASYHPDGRDTGDTVMLSIPQGR